MIVDLTVRDLETLIEWHREKEYDECKKKCYVDEEFHKKRAEELMEIIYKPIL